MGTIIVGGIVKKDDKYLLVQEAKEKCYGKWNIPAGRVDLNETILEGARREIFEESGYSVKLTGVVLIGNKIVNDNDLVSIIFSTEIIDGEITFDKNEILDARWFSYDEIMSMNDRLRTPEWITNAITNVENHLETSIEIIKVIK